MIFHFLTQDTQFRHLFDQTFLLSVQNLVVNPIPTHQFVGMAN